MPGRLIYEQVCLCLNRKMGSANKQLTRDCEGNKVFDNEDNSLT